MTNRWEAFERYLECGAIPIDNNRTEAALKYAILGRKAWLFFGNPQAGETAAILFTLTKSCNRHRVDPLAYLRDVYTRLPSMRASNTEPGSISTSELESLLPDRWIKEHPEHLIQERVDESRQRARRTRARRAQRDADSKGSSPSEPHPRRYQVAPNPRSAGFSPPATVATLTNLGLAGLDLCRKRLAEVLHQQSNDSCDANPSLCSEISGITLPE